jgi:hypothetical protein
MESTGEEAQGWNQGHANEQRRDENKKNIAIHDSHLPGTSEEERVSQ